MPIIKADLGQLNQSLGRTRHVQYKLTQLRVQALQQAAAQLKEHTG